MARMFPRTLLDSDVKSDAERKVFDALRDGLSDDWEVFHSAGLIVRDPDAGAHDGDGGGRRHTQAIHAEVMKLYEGEIRPDVRGPAGRDVELHLTDDQPGVVERLCGREEILAGHRRPLVACGREVGGGRTRRRVQLYVGLSRAKNHCVIVAPS